MITAQPITFFLSLSPSVCPLAEFFRLELLSVAIGRVFFLRGVVRAALAALTVPYAVYARAGTRSSFVHRLVLSLVDVEQHLFDALADDLEHRDREIFKFKAVSSLGETSEVLYSPATDRGAVRFKAVLTAVYHL